MCSFLPPNLHGKTMSERFTATVTTGIDACTTVLVVGDKGSPDQGSHFRRNFGEIPEKISFPLVTGKRNFVIFR